MQTTNVPYVKEYDKFGNLKNPIYGAFINKGLNRRQRRASMQKAHRRDERELLYRQLVRLENGTIKVITHFRR